MLRFHGSCCPPIWMRIEAERADKRQRLVAGAGSYAGVMMIQKRMHELLLPALKDRHALLADVADSLDDDDLNARGRRRFDCTEAEARFIMDLQLRRFSQESRHGIEDQAQEVFRA